MIPVVTVVGLEFGIDHRLRRGDRERVRLARHGQADHRQHQRARPAGDRRLPDDDRAAVHHDQSGRWISSTWCSIRACGWSARHERRRCAREETPFRRFVSEFAESGSRCSALSSSSVIALLAIFAQLDRAAKSLRPGATRHHGRTPAAGLEIRRPATPTLLGTDDQGRDMFSGMMYGLRISLARRRRFGDVRRRRRHVAWPARGLARRTHRCRDHAAGRSATVVSGDPGRADDPGDPRQRRDERRAGAGHRRMGLLRPHRARHRDGRTAARIHRSRRMPRIAALAHHVPPSAAELPAAADRHRHAAGRPRDRAGGDVVVSRSWRADHRAVARAADRQRLPVHAVGQILDQLLSGHRAAGHHHRRSTWSAISCATCSTRGCDDDAPPSKCAICARISSPAPAW